MQQLRQLQHRRCSCDPVHLLTEPPQTSHVNSEQEVARDDFFSSPWLKTATAETPIILFCFTHHVPFHLRTFTRESDQGVRQECTASG